MIEFKPIHIHKKHLMPNESERSERSELLLVRSANQCLVDANLRPIPQMLFAEFWHEGEICILFADSNLGKSILGVQIADSISSGKYIPGFAMKTEKQPVLYFDFEMSDKQFENRYSIDYRLHYMFDENFKRVMINPECSEFEDFEKQLFIAIERAVISCNAKVLVIDNLTYLKTQATDTSKEALPLMKELKKLAHKHNLSILALAHTPKRCHQNPITMNDLAGSKMLSNFADSIFAIGPSSQDTNLRYIKQIKARATAIVYDSGNVILCKISKDYNRLIFQMEDFSNENEHLRVQNDGDSSEINKQIVEQKKQNPNWSYSQIAQTLGSNKTQVGRVLKKNGLA